MWRDPVGHLAAKPEPPLKFDITIKQNAVTFPAEGKPQGKAFFVKPTDCPRDIGSCCTFDEVCVGPLSQIVNQLFHRAQGKTGAASKIDMPHIWKALQHLLARFLCRRDNTPCAPLTAMTVGKSYILQV